jgi:hypothetical protein
VGTHNVGLMGGGLTAVRSLQTWSITVFLRNGMSNGEQRGRTEHMPEWRPFVLSWRLWAFPFCRCWAAESFATLFTISRVLVQVALVVSRFDVGEWCRRRKRRGSRHKLHRGSRSTTVALDIGHPSQTA